MNPPPINREWVMAKLHWDDGLQGTFRVWMNPHVNRAYFAVAINLRLQFHTGPEPTPAEVATFEAIESKIQDMQDQYRFLEVAVLTYGGKREWVLYANNKDTVIPALFKEFAGHKVEAKAANDPNWTQYAELHRMGRESGGQ